MNAYFSLLNDRKITEAEELLKKTFATRNDLYAYDVIFGKYRDVVALSSFYEYLMSGRCTSLVGATGAYNIYEDLYLFGKPYRENASATESAIGE